MIDHFLGSREAIRLAETTLGWVHDTMEKKTLTLFKATIHLEEFEEFFSDVDRAISIACPFTQLGEVQKRYLQYREEDSAYRITSLVIEILRFFGETAAALECLGWIGVVVLSPCVEGLAFTAAVFGCVTNLVNLTQKVYDNYLIYNAPSEYKALRCKEGHSEPDLKIEWSKNLCEMTADLAMISTDFFKGLAYLYGPRGISPAVYRFWRSTEAISHGLGYYIDSKG